MDKAAVQYKLRSWYRTNKRSLPWRETSDPYPIWLSEVILQQTRVQQGLPYFERFLQHHPTVEDLAEASEDAVLKLWEGLGYYSRARNMHKAAKQIAEAGHFPNHYGAIRKLPGVGPYTAAAIASFAFGEPKAVLDGNVYRLLSRLEAIDVPIQTPRAQKLFQALADELLNAEHPAEHNQAMMEFGAVQCVPKSPNCSSCVLNDNCAAYAEGRVAELPVKAKAAAKTNRYMAYRLQSNAKGDILVQRRSTEDIWAGLYELPLVESPRPFSEEELKQFTSVAEGEVLHYQLPVHLLSHRKLHIQIFQLESNSKQDAKPNAQWCSPSDLRTLAFPIPIRKFLEQKPLPLPFE